MEDSVGPQVRLRSIVSYFLQPFLVRSNIKYIKFPLEIHHQNPSTIIIAQSIE